MMLYSSQFLIDEANQSRTFLFFFPLSIFLEIFNVGQSEDANLCETLPKIRLFIRPRPLWMCPASSSLEEEAFTLTWSEDQ